MSHSTAAGFIPSINLFSGLRPVTSYHARQSRCDIDGDQLDHLPVKALAVRAIVNLGNGSMLIATEPAAGSASPGGRGSVGRKGSTSLVEPGSHDRGSPRGPARFLPRHRDVHHLHRPPAAQPLERLDPSPVRAERCHRDVRLLLRLRLGNRLRRQLPPARLRHRHACASPTAAGRSIGRISACS